MLERRSDIFVDVGRMLRWRFDLLRDPTRRLVCKIFGELRRLIGESSSVFGELRRLIG
jgi:hypothetical protein